MFNLDRHIEILLLRNDCVIVPGFGGFVAHHVSAHIDEDDRTVLPPKTTVGFNQQLTMNDSLLVQSYVETYDYSYPEALRVVNEEVEQLRGMLNEYGYFDIHSVGKLTVNRNGNYEFEPISAGILSPRLYGLPGVDTTDSDAFISQEEATENIRIAKYNSYYDSDSDEKFIRISTSALRRGMVACIIILLLMVVPFINRSTNTRQLMSGIDTSFLSSLVTSDDPSANTVAEKTTYQVPAETAVKPVKSDISNSQPAVTEQVKAETPCQQEQAAQSAEEVFTVVLAARISQKNAEYYVADLHKRGMQSARVTGEGKGRKVVYGSFSNRQSAQKAKNELSADNEFANAWVTKL